MSLQADGATGTKGQSKAAPVESRRALAAYGTGLALAAGLFLLFPDIDLWAAGLFYRPGASFFLAHWLPVRALYIAVPYLVYGTVLGALALSFVPLIRRSPIWGIDLRAALFLLLALALGPGLLVNSVLKDHWGRARPTQVTEFGGAKQFTPALVPAQQCERNCSFPAGHPAMGFYLVSFAFLISSPGRRRLVAGAAIGAGIIIGLARMAQGGHFLSDVVFSGFLVCGTSWLLYRAILVHDALGPLLRHPRLVLVVLGTALAVALAMMFIDRPLAFALRNMDPTVQAVFQFITQFGLGKGYIIVSALLFVAFRLMSRVVRKPVLAREFAVHAYRALFVFIVVVGSGLAADLLKVICGRARPKLLFADDFYGFVWGALRSDYWSFPSGHATTIAALAMAFYLLWPRGLPVYLAVAMLVAASRVVIDAHYLSDIMAGAALGAATTWAAWIAFDYGGIALAGEGTPLVPGRRASSLSDTP
jgi:lipid A 4'-phosphatase